MATASTVASERFLALMGPNALRENDHAAGHVCLLPTVGGRIVRTGTRFGRPGPAHQDPTEQRPISLIVQELPALPHMSALENVAFGMRDKGTTKKATRARQGVTDDGRRRPWTGGPKARPGCLDVRRPAAEGGKARALVTDPSYAPDEPLAALDCLDQKTPGFVPRLLRERSCVSPRRAKVLVTTTCSRRGARRRRS